MWKYNNHCCTAQIATLRKQQFSFCLRQPLTASVVYLKWGVVLGFCSVFRLLASDFSLRGQRKVTKRKATHQMSLRVRCVAHWGGAIGNSLRSDSQLLDPPQLRYSPIWNGVSSPCQFCVSLLFQWRCIMSPYTQNENCRFFEKGQTVQWALYPASVVV